jgi:hypothetical protein
MRVPGLVVADGTRIESIRSDASLGQIANGATLPGIVKTVVDMVHRLGISSRGSSRWPSSRGDPAVRGTLARCPGL